MAELKKIPISFKRGEEDLYNFIKTKRNASCYIKDLVEKDMNSKPVEVNNSSSNIKDNNDLGFDF